MKRTLLIASAALVLGACGTEPGSTPLAPSPDTLVTTTVDPALWNQIDRIPFRVDLGAPLTVKTADVTTLPTDPPGLAAVIREWDGLQWVWASPVAIANLDPLPYGFRRATAAEFLDLPPISLWGTYIQNSNSMVEPFDQWCGSSFFASGYDVCDPIDYAVGHLLPLWDNDRHHTGYDILVVRDIPSANAPNSPPEVAADGDVAVDEGSTATNTGTVSDPDGDPVTLTASVGTIIDNGDGTWSWSFATSDGPEESQTVTVTADDGTATSETTFELTVRNVAPTVNAGSGGTIESGDSFTLDGSFTDPGADGPWTDDIEWGDGTSAPGKSGAHRYLRPGKYGVTLKVTDKDGATGSATVSLVVKEKAVTVDIKPGSDAASINLASQGVTPVAVLSGAGFDASTIIASSVAFGPAGVGVAHFGHLEDVNGDGLLDFLGHFYTQALGLTEGDTSVCLTGLTTDGIHIKGCDGVTIKAAKGKGGGKGK